MTPARTSTLDEVGFLAGPGAVPRDNGALAFDAPWQARALALAVAVVEQAGLPWDAFRVRLIAAIADAPQRAYYDSWAVALESLVVGIGLTTTAALDAAVPTERPPV